MSGPRFSDVVTWDRFELSVLAVFQEALQRLSTDPIITQSENHINHRLYWLARSVHLEKMKNSPGEILQFGIILEGTSQPTPDDQARAARLTKRPDLTCLVVNAQAASLEESQLCYYLECKRLGMPVNAWVFNENYSEHGIRRFVDHDWEYAKGCQSGAMIGYVENMAPNDILNEVNVGSNSRQLPSLSIAAQQWAVGSVNPLNQAALTRGCSPTEFTLRHFWVDLRNCQFVSPPPLPKRGKRATRNRLKTGSKRQKRGRVDGTSDDSGAGRGT